MNISSHNGREEADVEIEIMWQDDIPSKGIHISHLENWKIIFKNVLGFAVFVPRRAVQGHDDFAPYNSIHHIHQLFCR